MKRINLIILFLAVGLIAAKSQKCKVYIPALVGTEVELTNFDKKDKPTSIIHQKITNIRNSGDTTIYDAHQLVTDNNGKNPMESFFSFKCLGEDFYFDMNAFIDQKQMQAYKDMQMKVSTSSIDLPAKLTVGQTLKDGFINMEIVAGFMPITIRVDIINRKVEGFETITTPAGTFECVKISQDSKIQSIVSTTIHSVYWYSENIGTVKCENYNKDQISSYMLLTKITKP
jgi:hypothetical protein